MEFIPLFNHTGSVNRTQKLLIFCPASAVFFKHFLCYDKFCSCFWKYLYSSDHLQSYVLLCVRFIAPSTAALLQRRRASSLSLHVDRTLPLYGYKFVKCFVIGGWCLKRPVTHLWAEMGAGQKRSLLPELYLPVTWTLRLRIFPGEVKTHLAAYAVTCDSSLYCWGKLVYGITT